MKTVQKVADIKPRKIGFEAPEEIHGAIKSIVGWAEMNKIRPSGMPFTERQFLQGLVAGFWAAGQENWEDLLVGNSDCLQKIASPDRRSRRTVDKN